MNATVRFRSRVCALVGASALVLGVSLAGCGNEPTEAAPEPLASGVVNPVLHAFLSKARAAHHRADLAEQAHDRKKAIEVLESVTAGSTPPITPEVAEVLADTYARIADLKAQENDFDGAMEDILKGKALARSPTNFRGHLFEVEGVIEQARAAYLDQHGDPSGAAAARERAKNALDTAIDIQESVIYGAIGSAAPSVAPPPR